MPRRLLTDKQRALLKLVDDTELYEADNGRFYSLPGGKRRYHQHDPLAMLMRRDLLTVGPDRKLYVTGWGRVVLAAVEEEEDEP